MQKKIIALAIAAALTAPAVALADVTVYGKVKASYNMIDSDNGAGTSQDLNQISSDSSRIGFKGSEDLGGGLKAVWQIESEVNIDAAGEGTDGTNGATNTFASRNSFVGVSSADMGTVILGRHDTPYKLATRSADVFSDTLADNRSIMGGGHDARADNVVAYLTPNLNGFNGAIAYTTQAGGAEANELTDTSGYSLMGSYSAAGFTGSLAFQSLEIEDSNGTVAGGTATDMDAWKFGLGYAMAGFTANFVYENLDTSTRGLAAPFASTNTDTDNWYLSATYAFTSADKVKFAYTNSDFDDGVVGTNDVDTDQWSIGYDHSLSKNTSVFALYTNIDTDTGNFTNLRGSNAAAGQDVDGFSFGIEHNF